jgi:hypothetical protein
MKGSPYYRVSVLLCLLLLSSGRLLYPASPAAVIGHASLQPRTLQAFQKYVADVEARNQAGLPSVPFLWVDDLEKGAREETYARLKGGGVAIRRVKPPSASEIPGGLVHHWEALIFIPGVSVEEVLRLLQDYDRQATYYAPDVERARILRHDGAHYRVFLRFRRTKFVTVVLNTEHDVTYFRDSASRAHSRSSATRIAEVQNPGAGDEKELLPGEDQGFLWRMETWWRLEQRDGGVYVQNEVVSLTRDIPFGIAWFVAPFVNSIPRESLEFTMNATRKAVLAKYVSH